MKVLGRYGHTVAHFCTTITPVTTEDMSFQQLSVVFPVPGFSSRFRNATSSKVRYDNAMLNDIDIQADLDGNDGMNRTKLNSIFLSTPFMYEVGEDILVAVLAEGVRIFGWQF